MAISRAVCGVVAGLARRRLSGRLGARGHLLRPAPLLRRLDRRPVPPPWLAGRVGAGVEPVGNRLAGVFGLGLAGRVGLLFDADANGRRTATAGIQNRDDGQIRGRGRPNSPSPQASSFGKPRNLRINARSLASPSPIGCVAGCAASPRRTRLRPCFPHSFHREFPEPRAVTLLTGAFFARHLPCAVKISSTNFVKRGKARIGRLWVGTDGLEGKGGELPLARRQPAQQGRMPSAGNPGQFGVEG